MDFFLLRDTAPGRLTRGISRPRKPLAEASEREGANFAGKLADLFENVIYVFARRRDPAGDQARRALQLMGPGGDKKKAAQMLQPFAVGFSNWLKSEDDLFRVEMPEPPKPRALRQ